MFDKRRELKEFMKEHNHSIRELMMNMRDNALHNIDHKINNLCYDMKHDNELKNKYKAIKESLNEMSDDKITISRF
jgi:2-hydroxy-3-keto-5-methylthiopentenyl-1-phosphate phosphatase